MPQYLPDGLTQYVLNNFAKYSAPYHMPQDDVSVPLQRLEVERITGHQSVRGRGGIIAVMYETHWTRLSRPSWEREVDFQLSSQQILLYWAGVRANTAKPTTCIDAHWGCTLGAFLCSNSERFLAREHGCVSRADWLRHYSTTVFPNGAHFWYKDDDCLWRPGKISARTTTDGRYLIRFLDDPGRTKLPFSPTHYTTSTGGVQGSWCLQLPRGTSVARGIQSNLDESRGADVAS